MTSKSKGSPSLRNDSSSGGKNIRFLGILIERKTDVLAFSAFVLSVASIIGQIFSYLKGPNIEFIPPSAMTIRRIPQDDTQGRTNYFAHLIIDMNYVNSGDSGYDDIVKRETARLIINQTNGYQFYWTKFVHATRAETNVSTLQVIPTSSATPAAVPAGGVASHTTYFTALHRRDTTNILADYLPWTDFMSAFSNCTPMQLELTFETTSGTTETRKYTLQCNQMIYSNFVKNDWAVLRLDAEIPDHKEFVPVYPEYLPF